MNTSNDSAAVSGLKKSACEVHISQNGINLIKKFEGCSLSAYKCPGGIWTIGWGHTSAVKQGDRITQEKADELLKNDLKIYEAHVASIVKIPLKQNNHRKAPEFFIQGLLAGLMQSETDGQRMIHPIHRARIQRTHTVFQTLFIKRTNLFQKDDAVFLQSAGRCFQ